MKTLGLCLLLASGCAARANTRMEWIGLDETSGQNVNVQAGPMPSGELFSGYYRSQAMGDINMVQTGDAVIADYEYDRGSCHVLGHLEGTARGNLLEYTWREDKRACGYLQAITGRGFLLYSVPDEGEVRRGRFYGHFGLNEENRGLGSVVAVKVPGREPTLRTQQSSGGEGTGEGTGDGSGDGSGSTTTTTTTTP